MLCVVKVFLPMMFTILRWTAFADEGKIHHQLLTVPRRSVFAMSFGGESFSPDGAYDYAWDSLKPMKGKYTINYIQYPDVVECVCMLNDGSAALSIFALTTTTIPGLC